MACVIRRSCVAGGGRGNGCALTLTNQYTDQGRMSEETKYYIKRLHDPRVSLQLSRGDEEGSGDAGYAQERPLSAPVQFLRRQSQLDDSEAMGAMEMPRFSTRDKHWICWDTGELEPPGLQTRLIQPWPTPAFPHSPSNSEQQLERSRLLSRRSQSSGGRQQQPFLIAEGLSIANNSQGNRETATYHGFPVYGDAFPDRSKFRNRNVSFYDQPSASDRDEQTLQTIVPTFRAWHTVDRAYDKAATFRRRSAATHGCAMTLYQHHINKHPADLERSYRGHSSLDLETSGGGYFQPPVEYYPLAHHPTRRSDAEAYVHHESHFTNTQPTQRGYFIIHPDWVSERQGMKPKSAKHFTSSKGPNAFRYGSK